MGRGILLWMLGVPIPIIILLALFSHNQLGERVRVECACLKLAKALRWLNGIERPREKWAPKEESS